MRGAPGSTITALWNNGRQHLDVFTTDSDGTVWSAWWEAAPGWQPWFSIHPEQKAAPGAKVSAAWAAYSDSHLDLFMTDSAGTVWSCFWEPTPGWQKWFQVSPGQKMAPGAPVTVLWAAYSKNHLDVFATAADGTVWSAYWDNVSYWRPWFSISPQQKGMPGAEVTAVWAAYSNFHLDLFITGPDGAVWTTYWTNTGGWINWFWIFGGTKMAPGATVTALWAAYGGNHLDIFATDSQGIVWTTWWNEQQNWQQWFQITGPHHFAKGAPITAVWAPYSNMHLDLFCTGNDGAVWSTYWDGAKGWQPWFTIHTAHKAAIGATVTALWKPFGPNHLDIFMSDIDGIVWSSWWEQTPGWVQWYFTQQQFPWIKGPLLNRDPTQVAEGYGGGGRWYPSVITLDDGSVFIQTGHPLIWNFTGTNPTQEQANVDVRHNNTKPEIMTASGNAVNLINKALGQSGVHDFAPYYPRMFTMPHTATIFIAQPLYSSAVKLFSQGGTADMGTDNVEDVQPPYSNVMDNSIFYDRIATTVTGGFPGPQHFDNLYLVPNFTSQNSTGVLLPLLHDNGYAPRVLLAGAPQAVVASLTVGSGVVNSWQATSPRKLQDPNTKKPPYRNFCYATLLPTGDVVVSGGVLQGSYTQDPNDKVSGGVRQVEIYHPATATTPDSWDVGATANEVRGYHSAALLLPDGSIWTAGSEIENFKVGDPAPAGLPNLAIELYKPSYLSVSPRQSILQAPTIINYTQKFTITFAPNSSNAQRQVVSKVVLMRFGSSTHAFDGDQRYVSIPFTQSGTKITATAPPDGTVAPPGFYMIWLIDGDNLPCELAWTALVGKDLVGLPRKSVSEQKQEVDTEIEESSGPPNIRKPTETDKLVGGWRMRGRGVGGCDLEPEK